MPNQGENNTRFNSILAARSESKKAFIILIVDTYLDLFKKVSLPGAIRSIELELKIIITEDERKSLQYRYYNINKRRKAPTLSKDSFVFPEKEIIGKNKIDIDNDNLTNNKNKPEMTDAEKYAKLKEKIPPDIDKSPIDRKPLF